MDKLPLINACLNGLSAFLLLSGLVFVRSKRLFAHRACMISAFVVSCVFLVLYLFHKIFVVKGVHTPFRGPEILRLPYLVMLGAHVVLAIAVVPMAMVSIFKGLKDQRESHRRLARWTWPIWMFVSVSGVCVYLILYVIWPAS